MPWLQFQELNFVDLKMQRISQHWTRIKFHPFVLTIPKINDIYENCQMFKPVILSTHFIIIILLAHLYLATATAGWCYRTH